MIIAYVLLVACINRGARYAVAAPRTSLSSVPRV
jgi:hypothetical protein